MSKLASFGAALVRGLVRRGARIYYPTIQVTNRDRLLPAGPLLLIANHANSLFDPVLVGIAVKRSIHFLAKAPLFDLPVFGPALRALGMIPAYRASDDASLMKRNLTSLSDAAICLARGEAVGIFPEGKSHDAPRLEPLKTGAARMAIEAVEKGARDLRIVPLGLQYERKEKFRSAIWVIVGEPIEVGAWLEAHPLEERARVRALTEEMDQRLRKVVLHLDEPRWCTHLEDLEALLPPPREWRRDPIGRLHQRQRIVEGMNYLASQDRPRVEKLAGELEEHRAALTQEGLTIASPLLRWRRWGLAWRMVRVAAGLALGFIPAAIGTIFHLVPFVLTRWLARRVQAPGRSTVALTRLGVGIPFYLLCYAANWWGMSKWFLPWVATTWLVLMPFAGLYALSYGRQLRQHCGAWWREARLLLRPALLKALREQRARIRAQLNELAEEFDRTHPSAVPVPVPVSGRVLAWRWVGWGSMAALAIALLVWGNWWVKNRRGDHLAAGPALSSLDAPSLAQDEILLQEVIRGLADLEARSQRLTAEFVAGGRHYYTQADNDAVRQLLFSYVTYRTTLLSLIWKYQNHAGIPDERLRLQAFLIDFAAAATLYEYSLKFVARFADAPEAVRKFNEAEPLWSIPAGLFDQVRRNLAQTETRQFIENGFLEYYRSAGAFQRHSLVEATPQRTFHAAIQESARVTPDLVKRLPKSSVTAPIHQAAEDSKRVTYGLQAFVSTWLGSTRYRLPRQGRPMIQADQLEALRGQLRPGDILLERQNWYLSRAFMPGYWAHAALYVGHTEDLIRLGLDKHPQVARHWEEFRAQTPEGHAHVILEAVPEGVRITTLEHCIGVADSAAVLRPRLNDDQIREGIARAFSHLGKPYDFDFDFFSTDKLVCTELVFRSYDGSLKLPLVQVMGRRTLPPTELARKFAQERSQAQPQLDCVCFLDGDELKGHASFKDSDAFAGTIERPSMTWFK